MLHDAKASLARIASVPALNSREAAEDALKQINHEMCMKLLEAGEANARRAAMLREISPQLHDELVQEMHEFNRIALGADRGQ